MLVRPCASVRDRLRRSPNGRHRGRRALGSVCPSDRQPTACSAGSAGAGRTTACGFPQASMGPKIPARSCVAGFEPQIQDDGPDSEFGQQHTSLQYTRVDSALSVSILGETLSVNDPLGETSVDPVWLCRVTGATLLEHCFRRGLCARRSSGATSPAGQSLGWWAPMGEASVGAPIA